MFQDFEESGGPQHVSERLTALRQVLKAEGLSGLIVPSADEFRNEYVPPCGRRLLWLTGFSGSWGLAVILHEAAGLFVDGRYVLQAQRQTDCGVITLLHAAEHDPNDWLSQETSAAMVIGYDPRLHSRSEINAFGKAVQKSGASLRALESNPIDGLWHDRPLLPQTPLSLHPIAYAGVSAAEKLGELRKALAGAGHDAVLLTAPDSIAWLLNIRGRDVAHTPVALCFAIVPAQGTVRLFVDPAKVSEEVRAGLAPIADIHPMEALETHLAQMKDQAVLVDPDRTPVWFEDRLRAFGAIICDGKDPCLLPRARKNAVEIAGTRAAHKRDGAAVTRFLAWLDEHASRGSIDEIAAVQALESFRTATNALQDISFDSISGAGPNGAIVHYRVTRATNRLLEPGSLFLIDSGGQYLDGTTDITRTVAIGAPTDEMRRHFTLVLKAHITLATSRFPKGTRGIELDGITRRALWQAGLDFDHGTGHGVGSYLSVHEGPQGISRRAMAALEPGMIVSNEPGYYREGQYGIRIENLMLVTPLEPVAGGEREMMAFETLTLAPIDRRLVAPSLLTGEELAWLNAYHHRVCLELSPLLDERDRRWLAAATAPVHPS